MAAVTICSDFGAQVCHFLPIYFTCSDGTISNTALILTYMYGSDVEIIIEVAPIGLA